MNPEMSEVWKKEFRSIKKILPGSTRKALLGSAKTFQSPQDLEGSFRKTLNNDKFRDF